MDRKELPLLLLLLDEDELKSRRMFCLLERTCTQILTRVRRKASTNPWPTIWIQKGIQRKRQRERIVASPSWIAQFSCVNWMRLHRTWSTASGTACASLHVLSVYLSVYLFLWPPIFISFSSLSLSIYQSIYLNNQLTVVGLYISLFLSPTFHLSPSLIIYLCVYPLPSLTLPVYIYIYIYICVCVCVCVCAKLSNLNYSITCKLRIRSNSILLSVIMV